MITFFENIVKATTLEQAKSLASAARKSVEISQHARQEFLDWLLALIETSPYLHTAHDLAQLYIDRSKTDKQVDESETAHIEHALKI